MAPACCSGLRKEMSALLLLLAAAECVSMMSRPRCGCACDMVSAGMMVQGVTCTDNTGATGVAMGLGAERH